MVQDTGPDDVPATVKQATPLPAQVVTEIDSNLWVMHQCRNGDYWFGSNGGGVFRFDGQRTIQYTQANGLSGNQVRAIHEDIKGNVLVSTEGGVCKFDGKTFATLEVIKATSDNADPDKDGWELNADDLWIVLRPGDNGPLRYDGERLYHLQLPTSPAEAAHRAKYPNTSHSPSGLYSIYKDRKGHLWFGTADVGLCRYDGKTVSWMYEDRLTTTPSGGAFGIRCIFQDKSGEFWITNTRQRFQIAAKAKLLDGFSLLQYEAKEGLPNAQSDTDKNFTYYASMTEDNAGALWMAVGDEGIWKYDGDEVTRYPLPKDAYATTVFCDRKGELWAVTLKNGIYTFKGEGFEPFQPRTSGK